MYGRYLLVIGCALLLSACATTFQPPLESIKAIEPAHNSNTRDVDEALASAATLQRRYASNYQTSASARDTSQIPIIGAAAIAAWILLDDGANAARNAGRIGIGAGAYSAMRGQLVAADLPDAYIAGHAALTCVLSQGSFFSGTPARARYDTFAAAMGTLDGAATDVATTMAMQPARGTQQELDLLRTTKAAAEQALAQARAALAASYVEDMAYQGAGPVFWLAVSSISSRVASRGRQRPDVDYQALLEGFSPPGGDVQAEGDSRRTASEIIGELIMRTNTLIMATTRLRGVTPNYAHRLSAVADCPRLVG